MENLSGSALYDINVAIDGINANGNNHLVISKRTGSIIKFVSILQLGSDVHVTEAEVNM